MRDPLQIRPPILASFYVQLAGGCSRMRQAWRIVGLLIASVLAATWAHAQGEGSDLLLQAAYRLTPAPNYASASGSRGTELTDGQIGMGRVWISGQAVGWSWRTPVTVTFNLKAPANIDHVRVYAASGTGAGIYLPSQLLVFGGDGSGRFGFLGASALGRDEDSSRFPGVSGIDIRFKPTQLRQVVVVGFARGAFLMLSEIEAFGSAGKGAEPGSALADAQALQRFAIGYRQAAIQASGGRRPIGPDIAHRWAMPLGPGAGDASGACTAERIDPWAGAPAAPIDSRPDALSDSAPLVALTGGHDYAAWRIVNRSQHAVPVKVSVEPASGVDTAVFALAHAQALDRSWVPDVVTPFGAATLPPSSAMLVLMEVSPRQAGRYRISASIDCANTVAKKALALTSIALNPKVPPLHGNLWTYLHQPAQAPVMHALTCDADFLARYGIDTAVVHPDALIQPDGVLLHRYFHAYRGASRILLYMDIKTRRWAFAGMSDRDATQSLRGWWAWVRDVARAEGVGAELELYPIDEPKPSDRPAMRRFRQLARSAGIDAPVFATLERQSSSILPFVDNAQLLSPTQSDVASAAHAGVREIQAYYIGSDARLLSPNDYYRRQGWDAYALGLSGVGVWSIWDGTGLASPETGWNPFTGDNERDFGMLYGAPNGCAWPSLRLLAWRRGLEENRLLRQCKGRLVAGRVDDLVRRTLGSLGQAGQTVAHVAEECGG